MPTELRVEMTRAAASGHHAWVEARRNDDFASFLPYLRANVELKRRYIECFEPADLPYTALLDDYEPGMTTTEVREVFAVLRPALTELVRTAPQVDASFLHGSFDPDAQRRFAERVSRRSGSRTAPGGSTRPRTRSARRSRTGTCASRPGTGRTTSSRSGRRCTRRATGSTRTAIADSLMRTPLSGAPSLGDQRVPEPHVGEPRRPQPAVLGRTGTSRCRRRSPSSSASVELDAFVRAINRAEPGLIRVDADETTYSSTSSSASSSSRS